MCYVFRVVRCWLIRLADSGEQGEMYIQYAVCYVFRAVRCLADFASLIQESKERCIYSKLYAVCYVFRAVQLADFASLMQES